MPTPLEYLQAAAGDALNKSGLEVVVKTKLGPELSVYKAGDTSPPSPLAKLLRVGVQVRDKSGRVLTSWGEWPATSPNAVPAAAIRSSIVQMSRYKRSQPIGQREKLLTALGAPAAFKCGHGRPIKQQITAADIVEAVHRSPFQPHAGLNVMGHKAALKGD